MKNLFLFLLCLFFVTNSISQVNISERLQIKINAVTPLEYTRVLVLLKDRVDIEALDQYLYSVNAPLDQRSYLVITSLREKANHTQGPILNYIQQQQNNGKVKQYIAFWITNLIFLECTPDVIFELTKRNDVELMDLDAPLDFDRPVYMGTAPDVNESVEIGLKAIRADSLWMIGITGVGRTVMNIDGGVDGNHNALGPKWWGNNGRMWYHSWFDPISPVSQFPFDCSNHGTHTMGIMTGRGPNDTVGVAPDARWMAAGLTDCPGASYPSMNIAAFQWASDPDTNASTQNFPDAISCSWQDPSQSGTGQCTGIYVSTLNAVEAIGIAVCFSAGNSGSGASTITPPKNINTDSVNLFAVGAVDANNPSWPIASFSSRGPSICGGTGTLLIKPEVSAPGVSVRSCAPGSNYGTMSGTSMASPHVAGCIALLKQVAPNMTGKQLKAILFSTCTDLGIPGEDNDYGKGMINVFRAYQMLGPSINHSPLPNTENLTGPYTVNCVINPAGSPIVPAQTKLLWSRNNINVTDSLLLTNTSGNNWTGTFPGNGTAATYRYYIKTADQLGRTATSPAGAPANKHTFLAQADNTPPVITHTPLSDQPKTTWPSTVTCSVVDNEPQDYGTPDSVWVRWKIGAAGTTRHFKLVNTSGSNYAAAFNSVQADVNPGDIIYYRIIAQGSGSFHLKDSTAQYNFTITSIATACVGTGTTAVGYPYYTFYEDSRTQMLYTAAEILAAGGASGAITKLGFNVVSVGSPGMSGFNVRVQNTTLTTLTGWTTTGWTTCYSGSYTPGGTGIQYVTLTTPFAWNGTSNLLVEICYDNTSWSSNSTVQSTAMTGRTWHYHTDGSTGCTMTSGALQANRPNLCVEINTLVGNENKNLELPKSFALAQNYPNPFNPSTTINYEVPKQSLVKLIVYDVLGKEVATLVNNVQNPGRYEAKFDASSLSSGIYFYRMESGDFIDVKKMLLIK